MRVFNCNASISAAIRAVALSKSTEAPEPGFSLEVGIGCPAIGELRDNAFGVTPPVVKNCTLRGLRRGPASREVQFPVSPFNRPNAAFFGVMAERSDYCSLTPSCTSRSPISRVLWQHRRASLEVFVSLGVWPAVASKPTRTKNRIDGLLTALPRPARPTLRP